MSNIKATIYKGRKEKLTSDITIVRNLPNPRMKAIGSVVFLDHVVEKTYEPKTPEMPDGGFAHPHRGIATFSYLLEGGVHHLDSAGGEGVVYEGGIQWMNSGNGIIHDEFLPYDFQKTGGKFHALQFWLNLPSKQKAEQPSYLAVQGEDVPQIILSDGTGSLKILLGSYEKQSSQVPNYLEQFMYHIRLNEGKSIDMPTNKDWQYGLYMVNGAVKIDNTIKVSQKEIAELSDFENTVSLKNEGDSPIDVMFFGGEPYAEPMVSYGPFILNSQKEIAAAYTDFQKGKYGQIDYSTVKL